MPNGIKRMTAPKIKGNPFMKCRVAGYKEKKTPLDTSEHRPSTHATEANRAPGMNQTKT